MKWSFSGNLPVYQQIMDHIQSAVITGEFTPGEKIPSVRDMAMEARVNPNTMQHALHELEDTGLLIARGTSGRFVTEDPGILKAVRAKRLRELTARCLDQYAALGVSAQSAAQMLLEHGTQKEE